MKNTNHLHLQNNLAAFYINLIALIVNVFAIKKGIQSSKPIAYLLGLNGMRKIASKSKLVSCLIDF
jgi:hypothetical protein